MKHLHDLVGEILGTFILVFFGCGSVAIAILYSAFSGLGQIALIWGIAVALAIYATRHLSNAHLNPAVSIAMVAGKRMSAKKLPVYIIGQFIGAFIAAAVIYALYSPVIAEFEQANGIVRGSAESVKTAMMFGEFYPNPGASMKAISMGQAFFAEALGTFILVVLIFALTEGCNIGRPDDSMVPLFIGLTVTVLICLIAPLTQAGFNPARDLAPRLFSYIAGWKSAAWPDQNWGAIIVYVLGPITGGVVASLLFTRFIEPQMNHKIAKDNAAN